MGKHPRNYLPAILAFSVLLIMLAPGPAPAQDLPEDQWQADLNAYGDNFQVYVFYPTLSLTKRVTVSTALSGRYTMDAISAASLRSRFEVDGVASATPSYHGGGDDTPDELRHEFGGGAVQKAGKGIVSLNGSYGIEHDYSSKTLSAGAAWPFAKKNTVVSAGLARSWDLVFPQTRTWEREKNTTSVSGNITQILGKKALTQLDMYTARSSGFLSNAYQVVNVFSGDSLLRLEPVHPGRRQQWALGSKTKFMPWRRSSLEFSYRFYQDDWEVRSHTMGLVCNVYAAEDGVLITAGARQYIQSRAWFFKPVYIRPQEYMTVESRLDAGYSDEVSFRLAWRGGKESRKAFMQALLKNAGSELYTGLKVYFRHTGTIDWHSRRRDMLAFMLHTGITRKF